MNSALSSSVFSKQKNLVNLVYLLALIKFILPYLIQNPVYEPHRDEFLYLAESHHMAWGYLEVPPLMSVFGYLTNIMGGGIFWIKLWPSLFGAFTYILVARLIFLFGGQLFAVIAGFMPFVFGYFMHVHFMFQPNFLDMFFWTLMAYGLVLYIKTEKTSGLYIAGIALGMGIMSKYSIVFFAISLLIGLLLTTERNILLKKHFYYALLIGLIICLPNLIWQYLHGFPFVTQAKELQDKQLQNVNRIDFLKFQLLYNIPCIFTWLSGLYWLFFISAGRQYRFIGWAFLIVMAIFVMGQGKGYYGMSAYPVLFGFGAVFLERLTTGRFKYMRYVIIGYAVLIGCFLNTITLPFLPPQQLVTYYVHNSIFRKLGFLTWEDRKSHPLPQDFADMLGWEEMTAKVARVRNILPDSVKNKFVIDCDNYGEGAAIDHYGPLYHIGSPIGQSASYLFWTPLTDFYDRDTFVIVTDDRDEIHADFIREFESASVIDSITNRYSREFGSYIILLKQPSQKFRKIWKGHYESARQKTSLFSNKEN
ncbi:dolichyl-phosphate-mannose-protein mannosyltransferase [Mucilaginibacter frigoritolerans]|uniref:Dolichyl-phosphate-mannose-protein mannosyltransferase n=1 Tax=Mucilaginibacter frigoritolerans TaxID=652788 RepID=A0A562U6U6_9SPHI|nr:glycosyltransferase family 39 protein [Mucilaginibacter frigoritolerans]TWJ01498.1 dolichyl-phosphate-mannose-protein mannosyltransferase [Mucilaginibacter frigoritolerans]